MVLDREQLKIELNQLGPNRKLVFTNGCFDILHVGHVRYLQKARSLGTHLVVGLNDDSSVKSIKGEKRPIVPEDERGELLAALDCVNFVVPFCEDTPESLIRAVKPDILVKGGDWKEDQIVGADFVKSIGGQVMSLPFVDGKSTTNIIEKIQSLTIPTTKN